MEATAHIFKRTPARGLRKLLRDALAVGQLRVGVAILILLILVAVFAPLIATQDPFALDNDMLLPPSAEHWLGTDGLGRDVFSMVVHGTRTSLVIGVVAAVIAGIIGTLLGGIAGFYRGGLDRFLTETNNMFLMIPTFFLVLLIVAFFGSSIVNVILVLGLTGWVGNALLMRSQAVSLRERTFVKSAFAIGESRARILLKHIIPNGIYPIIANTTMNISAAILMESSLSFLGLGDPNIISWGQIISHGRSYLTSGWWISASAGLAIVITVFTFYLIGDGLNRLFNPKLQTTR
jgi:peptide/nickel transport system permease protein